MTNFDSLKQTFLQLWQKAVQSYRSYKQNPCPHRGWELAKLVLLLLYYALRLYIESRKH